MSRHHRRPPSRTARNIPPHDLPRHITDAMYQAFFAECPEALAHVRYRQTPGYDEPQMFVNMVGLRLLYLWFAKKGFTTPEKAQQMIVGMEAFMDDPSHGPWPSEPAP
jgi:hypothetical protein